MASLLCPYCKLAFKTKEEFESPRHGCIPALKATTTYELILALYHKKYIN